jgi:hypothetical protein
MVLKLPVLKRPQKTAKAAVQSLLAAVQVNTVNAAMLSQLVMKLAMAAVANSNVLRLP